MIQQIFGVGNRFYIIVQYRQKNMIKPQNRLNKIALFKQKTPN